MPDSEQHSEVAVGIERVRDLIGSEGELWDRFSEAMSLAWSLFTDDIYTPIVVSAKAKVWHCHSVESYIDQLVIDPSGLYNNCFVPTPKEALYLVSAGWLHDIGGVDGIFSEDHEKDSENHERYAEIIDECHLRTRKYIVEHWWDYQHWAEEDKFVLSRLCAFHKRDRPLDELQKDFEERFDNKTSQRLTTLAAISRLADACSECEICPPEDLMNLYSRVYDYEDTVCKWRQTRLFEKIVFNRSSRCIELEGLCPEKRNYNVGLLDLGGIVGLMKTDLNSRLSQVQNYIKPYNNLNFNKVSCRIRYDIDGETEISIEEKYLNNWPYLVASPRNTLEISRAVIQCLCFALQQDISKIKEIETQKKAGHAFTMLQHIPALRPEHFLIVNLCRAVGDELSKDPYSASHLKKIINDLHAIILGIISSANSTAQCVLGNAINEGDVLFVYGYCEIVANFLKMLKNNNGKEIDKIFVIKYNEDGPESLLGVTLDDENRKMRELARHLEFSDVKSLEVKEIPKTIRKVGERNRCQVLLGASGVIEGYGYCCKKGSELIVTLAHGLKKMVNENVSVVMFADPMRRIGGAMHKEDNNQVVQDCSGKETEGITIISEELLCSGVIDVVLEEYVDVVADGNLNNANMH